VPTNNERNEYILGGENKLIIQLVWGFEIRSHVLSVDKTDEAGS